MHYVTYILLLAGFQLLCDPLRIEAYSPQVPFNDNSISTSKSVQEALKTSGIIPDVLDDFEPSFILAISYPSKHKTVNLGNKIKPKKVSSHPDFEIYESDITPTRTLKSNTTYTLVLTDPDATSRSDPVKAQMCHWIATNISLPFSPPGTFKTVNSRSSFDSEAEFRGSDIQEVMPYLPPTPPPKTGYHRYLFVLLAPATDHDAAREPQKPKDRPRWGYAEIGSGVREWAEDNGLVAVGANFFYSQNKKQ
ncbi:hypothetical protein MMC28_000151 [Mycoblastus sanguinarius]|nr:hypothetical protein [Mycoblastus sanguinarius]